MSDVRVLLFLRFSHRVLAGSPISNVPCVWLNRDSWLSRSDQYGSGDGTTPYQRNSLAVYK